ncbi:O-succinylhomoserine sulfhydrylase [Futiania mangrovi]|uniref:O-succinylhomoserine sulfhydrylase n=1 Tax=Futiania mangrovi TaxID=2959716 RepID=A0A9J6PAS7_9PROT|nr:O-succinylhomoserine sulfhydrylase [Futiania mangrovii]MCP1336221.1 O-succinylhomoserine sulfhydrylase [Futiania mangrovii]
MPHDSTTPKTLTATRDARALHPRTRMVHGGTLRSAFGETSEAMFVTSGYVYASAEEAEARFKGEADGFIYSRFSNPTVAMFEQRLAQIEGAEACTATASGMSAVTAALMCQLSAGDHIVAARALFGSCLYVCETLLPRMGVACTLVDGRDTQAWARAVRPETKVFFLETPSNPGLEIVDLKAVCDIAHAAGARVVVDNVFATPVLQRPMEQGADVVVYSATKHIDGQGRCLGGAVLSSEAFRKDYLETFCRHTGPAMSPFNAWVLLKGLETLSLRVEAQCAAASRIADALAAHSNVARVLYPGRADHPQHDLASRQMAAGGTLVTFDVRGGKREAFAALNRLGIVSISNNLGDAKSLITHPATTTHQRLTPEARAELGITDATLRLSVGLEDAGDLIADLTAALEG